MPSPFAAAAAAAAAAGREIVGERIRLTPIKAGRYGPGAADPDRQTIEIDARVRHLPARSKIRDSATGRDFEHKLLTPDILAVVEVSLLGGNVYAAKDHLTRLDEAGAPTFEISAAEPDGPDRVVYTLVAVTT